MSRREVVAAVVSILLLLALAACGPKATPTSPPPEAPEAAEPGEGGTIIVGLQAEPTTLDSAQISDYNSHRAAYGMYDHLLRFKDESTAVEPGLVESWEISDDGLVYTLNLRKGVKFH
ncbi:MAG: ABC transporter substrate-binding protein, partial [Anaerolineae bacterium]|nr:ABC transporter substrate-binding protein [Anaerolineae bacterium]